MSKKISTFEYKDVWVDNDDDAITKRTRWYTSRGWSVVGIRVTSSSPDQMYMKMRRPVKESKYEQAITSR